MRTERKRPERHREVSATRFLIGFLLGILIGASIGLILAPQPGRETRSIVVERVKQRARRDGEPFEAADD